MSYEKFKQRTKCVNNDYFSVDYPRVFIRILYNLKKMNVYNRVHAMMMLIWTEVFCKIEFTIDLGNYTILWNQINRVADFF